ncbi:hypothetical protein ACUXAV_000638 [Cupriavidus metallidurans]|uniref:hypothetical protein n=2 Tax=Cupriavidus metallidurans TaxID=119219 RepID=UPI00049325A2|nr:hypothetical protein [Cupriavidus metallidurans]MDE4918539.1 hypothetical protein [Cupriavidus metallidurans]
MATGDQTDVFARLKSALPSRWFGSTADSMPVVDSLLAGITTALSFVYSLYAYAKLQTRILTATDGWLDLIAADFFGATLQRKANQSDASFRANIIANMFRERGTRRAIIKVLTDITGRAPVIFEPNRPADVAIMSVPAAGGQNYMGIQTGMYTGPARMASMAVPFTALIIAYRPQVTGGSAGGAFTSTPTQAAMNTPLAKSYLNSLTFQNSAATDADIYAAIDSVKPAATIPWTAISN